jgi:hypothetical protein
MVIYVAALISTENLVTALRERRELVRERVLRVLEQNNA